MTDRLGLAVVGYGMTATSHTRTFGADGHHLRWLIGRVPERAAAFANEYGYGKHGTDLEAALNDRSVDAVILCTPSEQHEAQALACLDAGKHVLIEIPVAMSAAGAARVADRTRASGLSAMVAHTHRYHPGIRTAHAEIAAGRLSLSNIVARYMFLRRENVGASGYRRSWTDNLLWHHGCHATDLVMHLLGASSSAQVEVASIIATPDASVGAPLDLSIVLRTADDRLATIAMSYNAHLSRYDYVLIGREDTMEIRDGNLKERHGVPAEVPGADTANSPSPVVLQNREFHASILEGRPPSISPDSVLPAMEVLQIAQDAADALAPR
ncbi:MAG: gfo/Idh/MocA family oxidoreductase [Proteobacteria bacterium]|jgi:2-hydroxy-4-carboxymuconate semialdehyde hemiacetal dehydrogenase|nr:gfo/Idh/MocA family oxidoreductase [Pseudomonadota bacterium]NBX46139.1 gfo/Idh/MocA family oxidoreductase [Chloroflexota bacterium]NBQ63305.1 gfo/Idh/MocA family oxidoreductase [Pseudomonadota bacterium]NBT02557.1 gfo/Idh/MocA family oxidoreductase [Pseudomonadota bacterium]NBT17873.1 gfo/Idh/MocA family oxidoreductase [Pseudomonadota bacterium]